MATHRRGFTLLEILISLLILSGSLATLFGGLEVATRLDHQAVFEDQAAWLAERELELLKTDLLGGRQPLVARGTQGRFRLPGGWRSHLAWTAPDPEGAVRLVSRVTAGDREFRLESFLYVPPAEKGGER